jgi:hypothetical protein
VARQEMLVGDCITNPIEYELPLRDHVCNYHYPYFVFNKSTVSLLSTSFMWFD